MVRFVDRLWPLILGITVLCAVFSCAVSRVVKDPQSGQEYVVVEGEHAFPGAAGAIESATGVAVEDVVGAAGEAIDTETVSDAVEDASSGNWLGLAGTVLGAVAVFVGGLLKRRKIREVAGRVKRKVIG